MRAFLPTLLLACLTAVSLHAQSGAKPKNLTVSIVSEQSTIAAGKAFLVAVKLAHAEGYHTYGKELPADGTGMTTTIDWKLPEGWKAEEQPWPALHETPSTGGTKVKAYGGTTYLLVKLTPPAGLASGSSVKLQANVKGLLCNPETCMPFKQEASLELKAGDAPAVDEANKEVFKKAS